MKAYVKIQSNVNITVTAGLQNENLSNPDAHIADRLKINALWPQLTVDIKIGQHWYPSEIKEWPTVKALEKDGILTVGELSDSCDEEEAAKTKADLKLAMDEVNKKLKKDKKLEEIAEE